jgi:hypothetical protein
MPMYISTLVISTIHICIYIYGSHPHLYTHADNKFTSYLDGSFIAHELEGKVYQNVSIGRILEGKTNLRRLLSNVNFLSVDVD